MMAAITPIAFIDTFDLAASLLGRAASFEGRGVRGFKVRWLEDERWKVLGKWPEIRNTLSRIKRLGDGVPTSLEMGAVHLEMLDPDVVTPWYLHDDGQLQAVLPIRTNPACRIYCGTEMAPAFPGHLLVLDTRQPHCAINLGETPMVRLIVDFKRSPSQ